MPVPGYEYLFCLMIRRPPRSTLDRSSAASDVYKRQGEQRIDHLVQRLAVEVDEVGIGTAEERAAQQVGQFGSSEGTGVRCDGCLLYTSPSPRDRTRYRMPSSA